MEHHGNIEAFSSHQLPHMYKVLTKQSSHVPSHAPPLSMSEVKDICDHLVCMGRDGPVLWLCCAILMRYFTFLRQSNLVSLSNELWCHGHCLRHKDIVVSDAMGLLVQANTSKTIFSAEHRIAIPVPSIPGSLCPTASYLNMCHLVKAGPDDPVS